MLKEHGFEVVSRMTVGSSNTTWYQRIHLDAFFFRYVAYVMKEKIIDSLKASLVILEVVLLKRRTLLGLTLYVHNKMEI